MKDRNQLLDAIHLAFNHPEYAPRINRDDKGNVIGVTTYCNQYVDEVCEVVGFEGLTGKMANEICEYLSKHPQWSPVKMEDCQDLANGGTLIVAGIRGDPHGHVCIICPGKPKVSGRWGLVPSCASVGKENTIGRGINWAFSERPEFWVWRQTL